MTIATSALLLAFLGMMAALHFFKTLDTDLWHAWRVPLAAGLAIGTVLRLLHIAHPAAFGVSSRLPRCTPPHRR